MWWEGTTSTLSSCSCPRIFECWLCMLGSENSLVTWTNSLALYCWMCWKTNVGSRTPPYPTISDFFFFALDYLLSDLLWYLCYVCCFSKTSHPATSAVIILLSIQLVPNVELIDHSTTLCTPDMCSNDTPLKQTSELLSLRHVHRVQRYEEENINWTLAWPVGSQQGM